MTDPSPRAVDAMATLDDLEVANQRVLVRVDLNVPLEPGRAGEPARVGDDARMRAALGTIAELRRRGARLILVSHLGRPAGRDPALSMRPVAERLAQLTGAPVTLAPAVVGPDVQPMSEALLPGEMLMLENVRYESGEKRNEDLLLADDPDGDAQPRVLDGLDVPRGWTGLDIGPRSAARYAREVAGARTAFWNGPMGRFELERFSGGTRTVAEALATSSATTVVGGGETVAALRRFGLQDRVTHVSTGGGATLELLEGHGLPGVAALRQTAAVR